VNIGTGIETSIRELYRMLARAAGAHAAPRHLPAKPGEQVRSSVDPSRAAAALGWRPQAALDEGIRATLEFFRHPAVVPSDRAASTAPRIRRANLASR
jgi:UDP-glucose 4-epimerase